MKLVFCGTPAFAVPALKLALRAGYEVPLVITQPDRPVGRAQLMTAPPVKIAALEAGLRVTQPQKVKNNLELRSELETIQPDAILVVAYGRIIPKWMLDLPRLGNLNLHGSLLPKYRGAAPIQWAIANGEAATGATTMRLDEGLDTGDILLQREMPLAPDMTSEDVFPRLSEMGADLMMETLRELAAGHIVPRKQDESKATLAPILTRDDGRMDFSQPAMTLYNRWRGFQPWPGAWTLLHGKKLAVHRLLPTELRGAPASLPGELVVQQGTIFAACGESTWLELVEVQPEGKRRMSAGEFLRGHALQNGVRLG
ncbi:MAG TPA: methionyl-tRNA formyltransferase [Acidobacteriaceae bacterium]|jgi:methionyl-tRNA formyltransferase|nr:methionyl-tRNA formyltransferase [Acidobacteriaceae bacterium]